MIRKLLFVLTCVFGSVCAYSQDILFEETFGVCTGENASGRVPGPGDAFSNSSAYPWNYRDCRADNEGWTAVNPVYEESGCLRVGNSSSVGSCTTPEQKALSQPAVVSFDVAPWCNSNAANIGEALVVKLTITGGYFANNTRNVEIEINNAARYEHLTALISKSSSPFKLTFTAGEKTKINSYYLDNIKIESVPISFPRNEIELNYANASSFSGQTLLMGDNVDAGKIEYSSSAIDVADVDANGMVVVKKPGTTIISAKYDQANGTDSYTASYELNVSKIKTDISFKQSSINVDVAKGLVYDTPVLNNQEKLSVVYSSSDPTIAVVDEKEGLQYLTGKVGTAIIKASFPGDDYYEACEAELVCTVTNTANNDKYYLVTSTDELAAGDKVIIVGKNTKATETSLPYYIVGKRNSTSYASVAADANADGSFMVESGMTVLTLEKKNSNFILKDADGKYLCGTKNSNTISLSDNINTTSSPLQISFSEDNSAVLSFKNTTDRKIGCYVTNASSATFNNYSSSTSGRDVWLYKKISVVTLNENDAMMSDAIAQSGGTTNVAMQRTFYNDSWNTWCAPFSISQDSIKSVFGSNTKIYEFSSADNSLITFTPLQGEIEAGRPCLVWPENEVVNPSFLKVNIVAESAPQVATYGGISFIGTYLPYMMAEDGSELFLNSKNKLSKPKSGGNKMRGLRAFFRLSKDINEAKITFVDTTTDISNPTILEEKESQTRQKGRGVYDVWGRKVNMPFANLHKGIYIINGRKIYKER